jgi:hypothetical protein
MSVADARKPSSACERAMKAGDGEPATLTWFGKDVAGLVGSCCARNWGPALRQNFVKVLFGRETNFRCDIAATLRMNDANLAFRTTSVWRHDSAWHKFCGVRTQAVLRVCSDGGYQVQACDGGYFEVRDRHGRRVRCGIRNGGFERYPGQGWRPVSPQRDER